MSDRPDHPYSDEGTAKEYLAEYFDKWLATILEKCKGREAACLLAIVRTADLHTLHIARQYALPKTDAEYSRNISVGASVLVPELLTLVDASRPFKPEPTPPPLAAWAARKLEQAGALYAARRLAAVERYGLSTCRVDRGRSITVLPGPVPDMEALENADRNWVNDWERVLAAKQWRTVLAERDANLSRLRPHYNRLRDGRLMLLAMDDQHLRTERDIQVLNALEYAESESFSDDVRIGPLTFGKWKQIAVSFAALLTINFQHAAKAIHAERLAEHAMLNLLAPFLDDTTAIQLIGQCCADDGPAHADEILAAFAADRDEAERFRNRFDFASPILIKVPGGYLCTQKGPIDNPYWYLTDKLKVRYAKQWHVSAADVTVREAVFQNDLERLFSRPAYAIGKSNVKLKRADGSVATDIDATVFERASNTIYLFQLKWPDVYAGDWRPRESRARHLRDDGDKWIKEVNDWLARMWPVSAPAVLSALDLQHVLTDPSIVRFRLVMLSRLWTRFSGKPAYNDGAAWISWTRLRKLLFQSQKPNASLDAAWREMCVPSPRTSLPMRSSEVVLPGLMLYFGSSETASRMHRRRPRAR
ncbi:hypothetical protein [Massilia oculi]|uniref:hypothetical protein n=1 Tax=Massilia oculi TaxID=945844 RepID=UPI0028B1B358|nr:hypothetical protein [Massilia oculi]